MRATVLIVVLLLGLVALFALQNPGVITVRFVHLSVEASVPVIVIVCFGAGLVAGFVAGIPTALRRRRQIRELEAKVAGAKPPAPPLVP